MVRNGTEVDEEEEGQVKAKIKIAGGILSDGRGCVMVSHISSLRF